MYLLSETMRIHPKNRIIVAHFNHCLRGAESDGDEEFLRDFCEKHLIIFESTQADITKIAQVNKK